MRKEERLRSFPKDVFTRIASWTTRVSGGRWGFLIAAGVVLIWAGAGPFYHYSQNWQFVINTGTSIVTFLMVFLIQNAQNRESKAIHLKLDELILSTRRARNELISVERLTEAQLDLVSASYHQPEDCDHQRLVEALETAEATHAAPPSQTAAADHITVK